MDCFETYPVRAVMRIGLSGRQTTERVQDPSIGALGPKSLSHYTTGTRNPIVWALGPLGLCSKAAFFINVAAIQPLYNPYNPKYRGKYRELQGHVSMRE